MNQDRMTFYAVIFGMICVTLMVSHCTYQQADCRKEAMKANMPAEKIYEMCKIGPPR